MTEHDITKSMLNKIRESMTNRGIDTIDLQGSELTSEYELFMDQITPRVDFNVFKIYPKDKNVVFSGKFQDMNGMGFQMSLEETDGLYINIDNLQLDNKVLERFNKLVGFYKNWSERWALKLSNEYKISELK